MYNYTMRVKAVKYTLREKKIHRERDKHRERRGAVLFIAFKN